jgi:hypothetical protein
MSIKRKVLAVAPMLIMVGGVSTVGTRSGARLPRTVTPAHKRFPQIKVQRLRGNPDHVRASQLWGANVSS